MILTLLIGALLIGLIVGFLVARRVAAHQIAGLASHIEPDLAGLPRPGFDHALGRLRGVYERQLSSGADAGALQQRIRSALDGLPLGVVVTQADGGSTLRNAAAENFLGLRHANALVDEAVGSLSKDALAGLHVERKLDLFGPPRRTVTVRALPLGDAADPDAALALIEDVTERSRLEAMRTDFVANISHELRTPVGALALLAETLADEDDPETVRRLANNMVFEAHRVGRIIKDLLELSKIEAADQPLKEIVGIPLVVAEAVDRTRPLAEHRSIRVEVKDAGVGLLVVGDRRQLVSALANLVDNAVKYSDAGEQVDVCAGFRDGMIELAVTDHGIGIPTHDVDRIFERFYRVDRARSRETGGTGLGLAIVRHAATNHGGSVTVVSHEGHGSTFTIRIPTEYPPAEQRVAGADDSRVGGPPAEAPEAI
jgi:two-component system, OmpR family, sensor histidine kinase SenX3